MAYVTGNVIRKGDYNIFATGSEDGTLSAGEPSAGLLWGTGFGPYGYGQDTAYIAPAEVGDVISIQEWNNLDAVIMNLRDHQQGPGTYAGQSALDTGALIRPRSAYAPNIQLAFNNIGKVYSTNDDVGVNASYSGIWGIPSTSANMQLVHTVTFPTADAARHFFNAGGKFKLNFSNAVNVATPRTVFWSDLCQNAGTVEIGYRNTTKTETNTGNYYYSGSNDFVLDQDNGGFWAHENVGSSKVRHFQQNYVNSNYNYNYTYDYAYGYGSSLDYLKVEMAISDNDDTNGNLGRVVTITTTFVNGSATDAGDRMTSRIQSTLVVSQPTTAFLDVASWGGYTVESQYIVS